MKQTLLTITIPLQAVGDDDRVGPATVRPENLPGLIRSLVWADDGRFDFYTEMLYLALQKLMDGDQIVVEKKWWFKEEEITVKLDAVS